MLPFDVLELLWFGVDECLFVCHCSGLSKMVEVIIVPDCGGFFGFVVFLESHVDLLLDLVR